jgi:TRAP-type C4-dicarboxylate transport system permease small subunit
MAETQGSEANAAAGTRNELVGRICQRLANGCRAIAGIALLIIVAINGANVGARYFFGWPFSWAEELMLFCMILAVFAGAIAVTWLNAHIRIDTFVERVSPAFQRAARVIATAASVAVLLPIIYASQGIVSLLYSFDQRTDALDAPMWIPQSFVTIGLTMVALVMVVRLVLSRTR